MKSFEMPNMNQAEETKVEKNEKESGEKKDNFDKLLVPEEWEDDITEAQKEAYRVKAFALGIGRPAEPNSGLFEENYKGAFRPPKTDKDLTPSDYEQAREMYEEFFEGKLEYSTNKFEQVVEKIGHATAGNIIRAYIELRARMLAKKESKNIKSDNE